MIKAIPVEKRGKIPNRVISLEKLAKLPDGQKEITYYPPRSAGKDSEILNLNKKGYLFKIANGKLTRKQALIKAGLLKKDKIAYNKAKSSFNLLTKEQKTDFINWLKVEKYI